MIRLAAAFSLVLALSAAALPARADALLRTHAVVEGEMVTLGDLFANIPDDKADRPVAKAPQPGRRAALDADWLKRVASHNGIKWQAASVFDQAIVERAGITIPTDRIQAEILRALSERTALPPGAEVELAGTNAPLVAALDSDQTIRVRDVSYDNRSGQFTAVIDTGNDKISSQSVRLLGRVYDTVEIPVPARALSRGEIITARDLSWQRIRENGIRRDVVVDIDQLIGQTPRQRLRPGQMISASEVQKPLAVTRGALVTMILKSGSMSLSAQGRAIEQGSIGDVVRLTNTHSNMTVEGRIEGPNLVSVTSLGSVSLTN